MMMTYEAKDFRVVPAWAEKGDVSEVDMGNGEVSIFVPGRQSREAEILEGETVVFDSSRYSGYFITESFPGPEHKDELVKEYRDNGFVVPDLRNPRTIVVLKPAGV